MEPIQPKKKSSLNPRQRWQLSGLAAAGLTVLLLGGYWTLRVSVLPELVPLLHLPTNSPAARVIAALVEPAPTVTPQPTVTTTAPIIYVPVTPLPDGEERTAKLSASATSGPSTVFLPFLNLVIVPTATPVPQTFENAVPAPDWPESLPGLTGSKLSLHVIGTGDPYVMEFVRRAHPRIIKAVDDLGWLADVKRASSATITIGRLVSNQDESWAGTIDPATAAQMYIASQLERYRLNPAVDYWEGWNEYDPNDDAKLQWYGLFEAERVCQLQALGLRGAVGGFAYGVPEYYEMELFMPALEAAHRCGGIFTLHEGVTSRPNCGVGLGATIPGSPVFPDVVLGAKMLRYRYWYEGYLKPRGLGDLPLVISELAIAPEVACGEPDGGGHTWKNFREWWVREGVGPNGEQAYLNLLAGYDAALRQDSYVWGVALFTAGAPSASDGWYTFDVHDIINPLTYYAVAAPPLTETPPNGYP